MNELKVVFKWQLHKPHVFFYNIVVCFLLPMTMFSIPSFARSNYQHNRRVDSLLQAIDLRQQEDTVTLKLLNEVVRSITPYNTENAITYAEKAYQIGQKINNPYLLDIAVYQHSKLLQNKGEYSKALTLVEQRLIVYDRKHQTPPPFLYHQLGKMYADMENYEEALNNFLKAFEIWRTYPRTILTKKDFYENIASLYLQSGQYQEALFYFRQLSEIARKNNPPNYLCQTHCALGIGKVYLNQENYDSSRFYLKMAQQNALKINDKNLLLRTYKEFSDFYYKTLDYEQAIDYSFEAIKLAEQLSDAHMITQLYNKLGVIYTAESAFEKAELFLKKAESNALKYKNNVLSRDIYLSLTTLYEQQSDNKKALACYKKHLQYKDSVHNEISLRKLNSLQMQFDEERHRQEIELLESAKRKEAIEKQAEIERTKTINMMIGLALVTAIIIALMGYSRYRYAKRTQIILKEQSDAIQVKNQELEQINQELLASKTELNTLNQTKDRFFSIIAHDLKSPLNSLKGYSHLIATFGDKLSKEEIIKIAQDQEKTIENLSKFLEDLLTWSRLQMKALTIKTEKIELEQIVDKMCQLVKLQMQDKNISSVRTTIKGVEVWADENAVFTVLRNLTSNAIKFTPNGGKIELKAETIGDEQNFIKISVTDNGVGIPEHIVKHIFDVDNKHSTKGTQGEKGTGLGLAICKELVEQNQGQIGVESTEGEGSTFWFTLPKADPSTTNSSNTSLKKELV